MKIIAIYAIALLLSSNVFASQDRIKLAAYDQNLTAILSYATTDPQYPQITSSSQSMASMDVTDQTQSVRQQDELLTEIIIYALIVMVYSFYWIRAS